MTTGLTQALAEFVAKPTFGGQEQAAYAVAKTGFIDTIATMMAGHREPVVEIVRKFLNKPQHPPRRPCPFGHNASRGSSCFYQCGRRSCVGL